MKQDKVRAKDEPNSELAQSAPQYTAIEEIIYQIYKPQLRKYAKEATAQLTTLLDTEVLKASLKELRDVYREIMKNEIAGNVKWMVSDRMDLLELQIAKLESELRGKS